MMERSLFKPREMTTLGTGWFLNYNFPVALRALQGQGLAELCLLLRGKKKTI